MMKRSELPKEPTLNDWMDMRERYLFFLLDNDDPFVEKEAMESIEQIDMRMRELEELMGLKYLCD